MKIAYLFVTTGHSVSYKLGQMILPQLEAGTHGVEVVGMFFFEDNVYALRKGDPIGERLAKVAKKQNIWLGVCNRCAFERGLAEGELACCPPAGQTTAPAYDKITRQDTVEGVHVCCFPDLYKALSGNPPDQVISL